LVVGPISSRRFEGVDLVDGDVVQKSGATTKDGAGRATTGLDVYDWPVIVRQYEELWDELLKEASRYDPIHAESDFRHGVCSYDYLKIFGIVDSSLGIHEFQP
jgi:hypothetical protein